MLARQEILECAAELVVEHGYAGLKLEGIARELGVTRPNLYYHFRGKPDLVKNLFQWSIGEYGKKMVAPLDDATDSELASIELFTKMYRLYHSREGLGVRTYCALAQEFIAGHDRQKASARDMFFLLRKKLERLFFMDEKSGRYINSLNSSKISLWIVTTMQGCSVMIKAGVPPQCLLDCRDQIQDYLKLIRLN